MRALLILAGAAFAFVAVPRPSPAAGPAPQAGAPVRIAETFDDQLLADIARTGAAWSGGALRAGYGGGSGRLGDLVVPAGGTVVLRTDAEDFSSVADPAVFDPLLVIDGAASAPGGFFDFASVTVQPGGTLRFEGPNPARLQARGVLDVQGTLDVSGGDAAAHDDSVPHGAPAPLGGPGGAAGGAGADQPDGTAFAGVPGGGTSIPGAMVDGADGGGIPEPSALGPTALVGGGVGGLHHPDPFPADPSDILGVWWDIIVACETRMLGGVGGGGGYALPGAAGVNKSIPGGGLPPPLPPLSSGGAGVAITDAVHALLPDRGLLRGGSGGGGGAAHLGHTKTNGKLFVDCTTTVSGGPASIIEFVPHSAPAGGGGGGALEVVAGNRLVLAGRIDASGGAGGGKLPASTGLAVPGGGGSGGAIRVLARQIQLGGQPARLDVSGGVGGVGAAGSIAGHGAPGLVRVESVHPAPDGAALAAALSPDAATLASDWSAVVDDVLSSAPWGVELQGPAALSGAQSCWRSAAGVTSHLDFQDDQPGMPGWDMLLQVSGVGPTSWRGANPILPIPLEQAFGTELFGAPIVVRFQGARSAGPIADPCAVQLHGPGAAIVPGSLTPWVRHPAELDALVSDPAKKPDLIRFQILFDRDQPFAGALDSVLELAILATPQ